MIKPKINTSIKCRLLAWFMTSLITFNISYKYLDVFAVETTKTTSTYKTTSTSKTSNWSNYDDISDGTTGTTSKGYNWKKEDGIFYVKYKSKWHIIVNKTYALPSDYSPGLSSDLQSSFDKMAKDYAEWAKDNNKDIPNLFICSGFRSYSDQENLYNNYASSESKDKADIFSARPGHSEHQTGLGIDIVAADSSKYFDNSNYSGFDYNISGVQAYNYMAEWLKRNCIKYGFILRYPYDKYQQTGYKYEAWHFRYLGDNSLCEEIMKNNSDSTMSAGTLEEFFGLTSKYDTVDKLIEGDNTTKELEAELGEQDENDEVIAIIDAPEDEIISQLNASQKDAYMIIANKYMTDTELKAMEWNLIISQFAIPYRENVQDVWNHTAFKSMREKGLIIDDNPYLSSIQSNLKVLNSKALEEAIDLGIDITGETDATIKTYINDIAECMLENNNVMYSPIYKGSSYAYVSDLFKKDTYAFTVKDKIAVTGNANTKTELSDALKSMQEDYLVKEKDKVEVATDVMSGSTIYDIELPIWINTDGVMMYNTIYVANAIRIGGYGNFDNFINSVGNSQLYVDRWGNICAHLRIDGEYKYVVVYPAYSNPIFTSTELTQSDVAGYVYDNFDDYNNYEEITNSIVVDNFWSLPVMNDTIKNSSYNSNVKRVFTMKADSKQLPYSNLKFYYAGSNTSSLEDKDFLGSEGSSSIVRVEPKTLKGESFSGVKSRARSEFKKNEDEPNNRYIIPILEVDTTNNMVFNKAILSAYSRDSLSKLDLDNKHGGTTDYYKDNWYSCLNDSNTTYSKFALSTKYNSKTDSALFSNSIIFDKYYTNVLMGAVLVDDDKKTNGYNIKRNSEPDNNYYFIESCTAIGLSDWYYSNESKRYFGYPKKDTTKSDKVILTQTMGLKTVDTKIRNLATVQYPFMQLNTYRKGLYSDNPKLQATKSSDFKDSFMGLNMLIADQYISKSFNYENTIATKDDNYFTKNKKYVPIEIYWNAMCTDSDKFRTYVIFNYTSESVPSNSVIYGMGHRLTKSNQGSTYHVAIYMDDLLDDKEVMGRTYMCIPLLDYTIDTGASWSIWDDKATDKTDSKYFIDSKQSGPRDRSYSRDDVTKVSESSFFEPVKVTDNNNASALRLILNDQRVSDILENYPLEDITLLSFVWRNYYTPETPFRTKLNLAEEDKTTSSNGDEASSKLLKLRYEEGVSFSITEDSFLDVDTVLTPYNAIATESEKVNNTLFWTQSCSNSKEEQMTLHDIVHSGSMIGESENIYMDTSYLYRASYNFGVLCLAINKNTEGDNLLNLVSGYDSVKEFDTDIILNSIATFFEHPVISLSNIFMGFLQMVHNNLAVGNVGNIFDLSWVIDLAIAKNILKIYIIISASICSVVFILRGLRFIFDKKLTLLSITKEWLRVACLSTVPVILLYALSDVLSGMSTLVTKTVAGELAMVEIEREVTSSENLNINFETVYTAYKEQFSDIEDSYSKLSMKIPKSYSVNSNTLEYDTITIKELYDSIEYSNVLAKAKLEASSLEAQAEEDTKVIDMYKNQNPAVSSMYYSYSEFVPVNYDKYDDNIFYYFYDWIKYQYLAYWASQSDGNSSAFSAAAKKFSLPESSKDNEEKWSEYISRMWDAELYMLEKSYNGMYLMYHDDNYVYNKLFDSDGDSVYMGQYVTDLLGLSNMFNMTSPDFTTKGYLATPSVEYINALNNIDEETDNSLIDWQSSVKEDFNRNLSNYGKYLERIRHDNAFDYATSVPTFYPLAYIMDNPIWLIIKTHNAITDNPSSNSVKDYFFTPSYLEEKFADTDWYTKKDGDNKVGYESIDFMCISYKELSHSDIDYRQNDSVLATNKGSRRIPWRIYASKSTLYASTFTGDKYCKDETILETVLMNCNKKAYKKIKEMTEYLQGDVRDSSLIFATALVATMEFNSTFSGMLFKDTKLEPQSFTADSMDLDKFLRITYAENMNSIVKNQDTIYMIYEQDGGVLTALFVIVSEIFIVLCMLMRLAVLVLLLLGCAYVCIFHSFHPPKVIQSMVTGLVSQLVQVLGSQLILLITVTQGLYWVNNANNTITRLLISVITLVVFIALTQWSRFMLTAMIKDFRNFGGAIIQGSVNSISTRLQSAYSDVRNNKSLRNIQAQMREYGYRTPATAGAYDDNVMSIRVRNSNLMDRVAQNHVQYGNHNNSQGFTHINTRDLDDTEFYDKYLRNSNKPIRQSDYNNALRYENEAKRKYNDARRAWKNISKDDPDSDSARYARDKMDKAYERYTSISTNISLITRHQNNQNRLNNSEIYTTRSDRETSQNNRNNNIDTNRNNNTNNNNIDTNRNNNTNNNNRHNNE